jgi:hypothetical protein
MTGGSKETISGTLSAGTKTFGKEFVVLDEVVGPR